jgi:hypothetical protein
VVLLVLLGVFAAACSEIDPTPLARDNHEAIPIPPASCPALRAVKDTAAAAADVWYEDGFDADWGPLAYRLAATLPPFDAALTAAIPRVPEKLAQDLRAVQLRVRRGIEDLTRSQGRDEYLERTAGSLGAGSMSLLRADAHAGDACGFRLFPGLGR